MCGINLLEISLKILCKKKLYQNHEYDEAYEFWRDEWNIAFKEQGLNGITASYSDKFINADEILVFKKGSEIIAIALINHFDLTLKAYRELSYFSVLPMQAWDLINKKKARKIMASGYNLVKKPYRKLKIGKTLISFVMPGTVMALFNNRSEFDMCIGMPLLAAGNHKILARLGMRDMHADVFKVHEVDAKFMYLDRDTFNLGEYEEDINYFLSHNKIISFDFEV